MHKEIMCKNDVLNSDNVGSAMLNLSDVMEDMSGLIYSLKPFIAEETEHELLPHIVRSLETFKNDIDAVHNYLDQICLNSVKRSDAEAEDISPKDFAAALCDNCDKAMEATSQKELDDHCRKCPVTSHFERRC